MADRLLSLWIRHGTTALNENNSFRGPLNPPLDEKGIQDAQMLRDKFQNLDIGEAYTSDKLRAQQTANTILQPHDIEPIVDKNLNAWNVGYLGGKPKADHKDEIDFYTNNPDRPIPGGESLNAFKSRLRPSIKHIVQRGYETGLPSLAVAHSSVIHEIGTMFHGDHSAVLVKPGGVVGVFHNAEKGFHAKALFRPLKKPEGYGS